MRAGHEDVNYHSKRYLVDVFERLGYRYRALPRLRPERRPLALSPDPTPTPTPTPNPKALTLNP